MNIYTVHAASSKNPNFTLCGESWQLWQQPFDADLYDNNDISPGPSSPPQRGDTLRQCQGCLKASIEGRK